MDSIVVKLPRRISAHRFLSVGATGWVYQINDRIVLKYARVLGSAEFVRENEIYDIFAKHPPCPFIVQSFLRVPDANFLPFFSGGSLDQRLKSHQIRDGSRKKVIRVVKIESRQLIERWVMELSSAVTWLESLGYVHGDLRPENLLLDGEDHLKLTDFDCVERVGTLSNGNIAPWARFLGVEAGNEKGTFGVNGPRTEQFAIGSMLYLMTRGFEPYEDGDERGPIIVQRLQDMVFPRLSNEHLDRIIDRCWRGQFTLLQDLTEETKRLSGAISLQRAECFSREYCQECQEECQQLVDSGLLADTP